MAKLTVDTSGLKELGAEIVTAQRVLLARLAERGFQLLRDEVPVETGNLKQGVAPPEVKFPTATLTVSARSARIAGGSATVHNPSGSTKQVTLRPMQAYNYAERVARGRDAITPQKGRALLIPVSSAPDDESYLSVGGKIYVLRRSAKAVPANPYDERAGRRLEGEAGPIAEAVLREFFN